MNLLIGGACQNKCRAACDIFKINRTDIADGNTCEFDEIFRCRAVSGFHLFVRRMIAEKRDTQHLVQDIISRNPDIVIISDEIGYGIVPMDAEMRKWRECTGRICCEIAANSDKVVRVMAGLAQVIKGD